ncbi:PHP domain-containing protein [Aeromicrobium sp.]|uniref:PHP domain-containing protein n=1 Tax=Aeromicrobium sp. TaxID=1871063 RepID=UPI00198470DE|nr:PHP domain-containing protein [Aeromicrobium sp.]MBC7632783.1 PHP domain-containing protein [Aeromicrobium sp.]
MRIDLHTHSNRSDGTDSPSELVSKAVSAGLDVVALTDHDSTAGWEEAEQAAMDVGRIELVRGIEVSTKLDGKSIHLLGYEFDPTDVPLLAELDRVLTGRNSRLPGIIANLNAIGIDITAAEVDAKASNAKASGRPHVADVLVDKRVVVDRDEAFDLYLMPGRPGYVHRYAADLPDTIRLLKAAGGKTVLAHPWSRGSDRVLTPARIAELADLGLDGLEVDHNDHGLEARARLGQLARELGLVHTGSSDYHGTGKSARFSLGCHTTARDQFERLLSR